MVMAVAQRGQHTQSVCLGLLGRRLWWRERVMLGDKVQLSDADDSQPSYFLRENQTKIP